MDGNEAIRSFLASPAFGVAGVSNNRRKYGNKILRCYLQHGMKAVPVHQVQKEIEGIPCVAGIQDLPEEVKSLSMITPPEVTEKLVPIAIRKGIRNIWMQPGAESEQAVQLCRDAGVNVIADGSCLLVTLGYEDH